MRWTYTFFIAIHLLVQTVAHPIFPVGTDKGGLELTRREPLPAQPPPPPRRSTRLKKQTSFLLTSATRILNAQPKPRQKPPKTAKVKARLLKSHDYRQVAMAHAKLHNIPFKMSDVTDHVLEAQMVSTHIDGPIDEKCLKALRVHLNAPDNLVLVHDKTNLNKATGVGGLIHNPENPKHHFSDEAKAHIRKHAPAVKDTAKNIDQEFHDGHCKDVKVKFGPNGVQNAAERMIKHAQ
ncbi:hypothetical protein BJ912DRAFT_969231 [Pholiota molesta]|nr:hypothetical protein BJ912DRAFT_969231 [Pholiota molesta]